MESAMKKTQSIFKFGALSGVLAFLAFGSSAAAQERDTAIIHSNDTVSTIASTVPANGDVNPYGVVRVTKTVGNLTEGDILVSNFNNSQNLQGTGTTIVDISPNGSVNLFAQINPDKLPGPCPGGVGLTTALTFLREGWVIVGSLPTKDGSSATAKAGCLIVLSSAGKPVETFYGSLINGPWDMTALDEGNQATLFVTNVLNGTVAAKGNVVDGGTVVRINLGVSETTMPWIEAFDVIGSGFEERTDPAALVIGPTGVGLSRKCAEGATSNCTLREDAVLYVADTLRNRVVAIPNALTRVTSADTGTTVSSKGSLNGPLGLAIASNGDILTVNGIDGYITEITPEGKQVAKFLLDDNGTPPGGGALFGLVGDPGVGIVFVDDDSNSLNVLN
jgi:hypothetical protein